MLISSFPTWRTGPGVVSPRALELTHRKRYDTGSSYLWIIAGGGGAVNPKTGKNAEETPSGLCGLCRTLSDCGGASTPGLMQSLAFGGLRTGAPSSGRG